MKKIILIIITTILYLSTSLAQNFSSNYSFRNYSLINKIEFTPNASFFYTPYGLLKKDYKNNEWSIDTTKKRILPLSFKETQNNARVPLNFQNAFKYDGIGEFIIDSSIYKNQKVYLTQDYGDGYIRCYLLDVNNLFNLHLPFEAFKVYLKDNYVYMLNNHGFIRVKIETDKYEHFYFLPYYHSQTKVLQDSNFVWFVNEIGIQRINIQSHLVDYWDLREISKNTSEFYRFSNLIKIYNNIVLVTNGGEDKSIMFIYSYESNKWTTKDLVNVKNVSNILQIKDEILVGCNYLDNNEGGDDHYGGLFRFNMRTNVISKYSEISDDELIVEYSKRGNLNVVETIHQMSYQVNPTTYDVCGKINKYIIDNDDFRIIGKDGPYIIGTVAYSHLLNKGIINSYTGVYYRSNIENVNIDKMFKHTKITPRLIRREIKY